MSLNETALELLFQRLGTPDHVRDMVRDVRKNGPVRRVQGGRGVMARIASRKNRKTRQSESRTLEAPACTTYERDPMVLEYYDQPLELKLPYARPGSTRKASRHVPDFLVIRESGIVLEEWKEEDWLRRSQLSDPGRYVQDAVGAWRHPPAEEKCRELGIEYRLRTDRELNPTLVRNYRLLEPFVGAVMDGVSAIVQYVADVPGVSISEATEHVADADISRVLTTIANGLIWVDLDRVLLTQHTEVQLYPDEERGRMLTTPVALVPTGAVQLLPGMAVLWSGVPWTVANAGPDTIGLVDHAGNVRSIKREAAQELVRTGQLTAGAPATLERRELLGDASRKDLDIALARLAVIRPYLEDGLVPSARTHQDWLRRFRDAAATWGDGILGLLPRRPERSRRADPRALEIAHDVIRTLVLTPDRRVKSGAYLVYEKRCADAGVRAVSRPTFRVETRRLMDGGGLRQRYGRKTANASAPPRPQTAYPPHGDRAFEKVHVDHTLLDIELVDSATGELLGRPWLTLAIDAYTRRIVGHVLDFTNPSSARVVLMLRSIVDRHGRLPSTLMLDNGTEFKNAAYIGMTAASYEVTLEYRPPSNPRFGAIIETCFGKLNRDLVWFMRGNTVGRKDVRSQDPKHDAGTRAVWHLPALEKNLTRYFYEVYDTQRSTTTGLSPRERWEASLRECGISPREAIANDLHFRIHTAPLLNRKCKVTRQGVKAGHARYDCAAFHDPDVRGTKVDVRLEPFDRSTAYAFVKGQWHVCRSTHAHLLKDRGEVEVRLAAMELTARLKRTPKAKELADHLEATLETEEALLARRRAQERLTAAGSLERAEGREGLADDEVESSGESDPLEDEEPGELEPWDEEAA